MCYIRSSAASQKTINPRQIRSSGASCALEHPTALYTKLPIILMTSPFNMQAMQQHHQLCRARHAFHAQAHQHTQKTTRRSAAKAQGKPLESHQEVVQGVWDCC